MNLLTFFISFLCVILEISCHTATATTQVHYHFCEENVPKKDFITAALEFEPMTFNISLSALDYMLQNLGKIQELIENQGQNVDILVLPEYSLTSTAVLSLDLHQRNQFAQEIPRLRFYL